MAWILGVCSIGICVTAPITVMMGKLGAFGRVTEIWQALHVLRFLQLLCSPGMSELLHVLIRISVTLSKYSQGTGKGGSQGS